MAIPPAGATPAAAPPVVLTFHGSTSSEADKDFTYGFTVPIDHRFAVSWATTPYPPGAHGPDRTFGLAVGAYRNPNNVPCGARDMWCGPDTTPPAGSQTFFIYGSGRFGIGVFAAETHWVIHVTITPVPPALIPPKPQGPGIGNTIAIAASPGAYGAYHVTLQQIYNTLAYDLEGFPAAGSHPLVAKFSVNDTGATALNEDPQSDANALLLRHDYPPVAVVKWSGTGKAAGTRWELESDFENPKATTGFIDGMKHTGCPAPNAPAVNTYSNVTSANTYGPIELIPGSETETCVVFSMPVNVDRTTMKVCWTPDATVTLQQPTYCWMYNNDTQTSL